ncbi:MAG: hypothetical protein OES26_23005 [Gammaproteobacteria bacterium]|nr:hypothetical protein [Gammaproteobacteria bacterium]
MKRKCKECGRPGLNVSRVLLPNPVSCKFCGTEHVVSRFENVPYVVAGGLLVLLVVAWWGKVIHWAAFVALLGAWLVFDFLWGVFIPLRPVGDAKDAESDSNRKPPS